MESSFAERHDLTIFIVENSLVRQGKPVTIFTRPYRQSTPKYERTSVNFEPCEGMANTAEPDQIAPQALSGQGLHCFAQTLSGCLGLLRKGKTWIIAKFHTDINTVVELKIREYCMMIIACFFSFLLKNILQCLI